MGAPLKNIPYMTGQCLKVEPSNSVAADRVLEGPGRYMAVDDVQRVARTL